MSFIKLDPNLIENVSLTLRPNQKFISHGSGSWGTLQPPTGSIPLVASPSKCIKTLIPVTSVGENSFDSDTSTNPGYNTQDYEMLTSLQEAMASVAQAALDGTPEYVFPMMEKYLSLANNNAGMGFDGGNFPNDDPKQRKKFGIFRFQPPYHFDQESTEKNIVRNILIPSRLTDYPNTGWHYTNYNTLNFYTASELSTGSCMVYPNVILDSNGNPDPYIYTPTGSFSVDFYINPRYSNSYYTDGNGNRLYNEYRAGTILHLSSTFAISLISGSGRDYDGGVDGYRIMLQLSHSADIDPSTLSPDSGASPFPSDLVFFTDDNSLSRNHWHHVNVSWGGKTFNEGSGSIYVDKNRYDFSVPSSSISTFTGSDALFVGNYLSAGTTASAMFFNSVAASREGVTDGHAGIFSSDPPAGVLNHPLNAEIHDIKIYNKNLLPSEVSNKASYGSSLSKDLLFYVPVFYVKETRERRVMVTPFQYIEDTTGDPFNVQFSFGVGGWLINLQNYCREFVQKEYPRLYHLTASLIGGTVGGEMTPPGKRLRQGISAKEYTETTGSLVKINHSILPCDNGLFAPNYELLRSGTVSDNMDQFVSQLGALDLSLVSVANMIPTATLYPGLIQDRTGSMLAEMIGASPENPGVAPGSVLTIFQRTRDPSSNEVTFFDVSNLFYGNRLFPETISLQQKNIGGINTVDDNQYSPDRILTASKGPINLTFKDNGQGSMYRSDSLTSIAKWSNCGSVLYEEGIVVITTPHAHYFGESGYEMSFKGEQDIHILTFNVPSQVGLFNSSSNPQYKPLSASFDRNDRNSKFVYLTNINIHDDNLNVIMKVNLAQPITKRIDEGFLFKVKQDF